MIPAFSTQYQRLVQTLRTFKDMIKPSVFDLLPTINVSLQCFRTPTMLAANSEGTEEDHFDIDPVLENHR